MIKQRGRSKSRKRSKSRRSKSRRSRSRKSRSRSKGKVILPPLKRHFLDPYKLNKIPYTQLSVRTRRNILRRAMKAGEDPHAMFRRMNVLAIFRKNKTDLKSLRDRRIFLSDRDWIKKQFFK